MPGAPVPVPGAPPANGEQTKSRRKKGDKKAAPAPNAPVSFPAAVDVALVAALDAGADGDALGSNEKKIRNLSKKLKAIEELKQKQARGDRLEGTQVKKLESEQEIRSELKTLEGK